MGVWAIWHFARSLDLAKEFLLHLVDNYRDAVLASKLYNRVRRLPVVGLAVVAITPLVAVPAGYSLTRLAGRWGERLGIRIFLAYLVPPT